jgi:asparagine synthase (glutamine-hydrolysing)
MCGIIGFASARPCPHRGDLARGRDAMIHRGPDGFGEWWTDDGSVGLGHRRLSILDLSSAGQQPMRNDSKGLVAVFNGEIYNFRELRAELEVKGCRFRSSGDTEVLLAAYEIWGEACVSRLNGMFAFAIYDVFRKTVFLARDRAGEKPLFYHFSNGDLLFASELKALLVNPEAPRSIDPDSLHCYLAMGFVPGGRCILQGYNKLPPAHAMRFDITPGAAKIWRYWQPLGLESRGNSSPPDEEQLVDELEGLLENAVSLQMVADVPVGVLLSGGVDSSLITAMAVRQSPDVRTFTIGFPGHNTFNESEHARLIARHFGTRHFELEASPAGAELLPMLARQFDEPVVDSSMIPTYLVSKLVREHCTVALGGDGGDELFAGYRHYSRLLWMAQRLGFLPLPIRRLAAAAADQLMPQGFKGRNWLRSMGIDFQREVPLIASYFDPAERRKMLGSAAGSRFPAESLMGDVFPQGGDLLQRATRMDFQNYLAEDILVKVDRASMLNSLEVRSPLLDYRIINFAFGKVPSRLKASTTEKKLILKRLCQRILPDGFDYHRKQGFSIPISSWLKGGAFRDLFWEVLLDPQSIFDRSFVRGLLEGQDRGRANGERLFGLVIFELWRREYRVQI